MNNLPIENVPVDAFLTDGTRGFLSLCAFILMWVYIYYILVVKCRHTYTVVDTVTHRSTNYTYTTVINRCTKCGKIEYHKIIT